MTSRRSPAPWIRHCRRAALPALCLAFALAAAGVRAAAPEGENAKPGWFAQQRVTFKNRGLMEKAYQAVDADDYATAAALFRKALENDPRNPEIIVPLIDAYNHLGKWQEGIFLCNVMIQLHPRYIDAYFSKAYMALNANDRDTAVQAFEQILATFPAGAGELPPDLRALAEIYQPGGAAANRMPEVYRSLAQIHFAEQNYAAAEKYGERWRQAEPASEASQFLAECALRQQHWPEALARLDEAQAAAGAASVRGLMSLKKGYVHYQVGDLDNAEAALRDAQSKLVDEALLQQADAQLVQIALDRGYRAYKGEDYAGAEKAFQEALLVVGKDRQTAVRRQLAESQFRLGKYPEAADNYLGSLEAEFDEPPALAAITALANAQQWQRGTEVAEKVLAREGLSAEFKRQASEQLMHFHLQLEQNLPAYDLAVSLQSAYPERSRYVLDRAVAADRMGRTNEAFEMYWRYMDLDFAPTNALNFHFLLKKMDRPADSEKVLTRILQVQPLDPAIDVTASYELAQVYRQTGRTNDYIRTMTHVVEKDPVADRQHEFAVELYGLGEREPAAAMFRQSLETDTNKARKFDTCKTIANIYLSLGRPADAREWLDNARKEGTPDRAWHVTLARVNYLDRRYEDVVTGLLEQDQKDDEVNLMMGFAFYQMREAGMALMHFNRVQAPDALRPDERFTYYANRAHLNFDQSQFEAAAADAAKAVEAHAALQPPDAARAHESLRMSLVAIKALAAQARHEEARQAGQPLLDRVRQQQDQPELQADFLKTLAISAFALTNNPEAIALYTESLVAVTNQPDLYYLRGLAYERAGEPDLATNDFATMLAMMDPVPPVLWGDLGIAYGRLKAYEQGTNALWRSLETYPYDIDAYEELGYQLMKMNANTNAGEAFKHAINLYTVVLPYVDEAEHETYHDNRKVLKREEVKLDRLLGFQAYLQRTEYGSDKLAGDVPVDTIGGALISQLGVHLMMQPPDIGFRDEKILEIFGRLMANFQRDSWDVDDESWQAGVGLRYKPIKVQNIRTSIERLIAIGDNAEDNWLWRNIGTLEFGEKPRKTEEWWFSGRAYGEASYFIEDPSRWVYYADGRLGTTFSLGDVLLLNLPQGKAVYRHETDDPDGISSYTYAGIGFEVRALEWERKLRTEYWYFDLYAHYVWGEFDEDPVLYEGRDFEGLIFGLNFYK